MSYEPSEVAVLAISIVAGLCILGQREWFRRSRFGRRAITWFSLQIVAWCCTILEGFADDPVNMVFNVLEHLFYALAGVWALLACRDLLKQMEGGRRA